MVKYLTVSLAVNLLLFSLYSYWVGSALRNAFSEVEKFLPPLKVTVKVVKIREENKREENPTKVSSKTPPPPKPSLLEEVFPVVEREYQTVFRKIVTKAKASMTKGGKVKISLNRAVVYAPPLKPLRVNYPPSPLEVKVTVLPDGRVINAVLLKRSGNPKVDRTVLNFVRNLKFEPINESIIQEIYILFRFKF